MWGLTLLTRYIQTAFDAKVSQRMRYDLFASVIREGPNFFMEYDLNRLNNIVNQLSIGAQVGLRQLLIDPVLQFLSIAFTGTVLFGQILSLKLEPTMWIVLGAIAVMAFGASVLVIFLSRRLQSAASNMQEQNLRLSTLVGNALKSPEEIQALQAETFFDQKHQQELDKGLGFRLHQTFVMERTNTLNKVPSDVILMSLMALLVFVLGPAGGVSSQNIMALILLTPQFMGQVQAASSYFINRNTAWPSIALVNDILSRKSEIAEGPKAADIASIEGTVEAKDVVFSYRPGVTPPVLNHFSLKLTPGQWTGLVARSGSGKSTFFRLILRFFDYQEGEILLGGRSVRDFTLASLRRHVSLLVQAPAFFYDTLRENMRVANPAASDADIEEACRMTGIWDILVTRLGPTPLDQELAAGGMLSGGQKRRLALSRGLLRRPSVIFMDEPTVGLSPEDKFPLISTLRKACDGKTVLLVEQDILWLEQICDYIFVLDGGAIVQQGTPADLNAQGGLYVQLRDASSTPKKEKSVQEKGRPSLVK
jgi:ABC-type multidrug transport system fused ATPase/permease subunit